MDWSWSWRAFFEAAIVIGALWWVNAVIDNHADHLKKLAERVTRLEQALGVAPRRTD